MSTEGSSSETKSPEMYESQLWQKAEELSQLRTSLTEYQLELYTELEAMRTRHLNLHERDILAQKEAEYWRVHAKVQDIVGQEDQVTKVLENIESGIVDVVEIQKILPPSVEENELSKKKQRIQEEKEKLGVDPREISWDLYHIFGSVSPNFQTGRVTTGRNLRKIKGNFDSYDAEGEFHNRTADTHGGKVGHGKKANYFVTARGRKIRKA